jgi:hypothetical protein
VSFPQPHTVTILTRGTGTDSRGDEVNTFTESTVKGWMQQIMRPPEETVGDRDERVSRWLLYSTATPDLTALDRIRWNGKTFACDGQPNHLTTPRGYHHTEASLSLTEG